MEHELNIEDKYKLCFNTLKELYKYTSEMYDVCNCGAASQEAAHVLVKTEKFLDRFDKENWKDEMFVTYGFLKSLKEKVKELF